jgi:pimeloyl-ACP methyl ester carboxylesterase
VATDVMTDAQGTGAYAQVNGLVLYYEIRGSGRPLILLHGGLGSGEMFGPILPALTERHQVVAVDLQGHGRTADINRPLDVRTMAGDIAALIDHLELEQPDLLGYSLGGWVALQTAARYPGRVGRLVTVSTHIRSDALYAAMRDEQAQLGAAAAEFMKDTPMYELYQRVAPRPADFPRLLDKVGEAIRTEFDFSREVRSLRVPTLVVAADADMVPPSHYVEIFELLGGGVRDGGFAGEHRPEGGHALAILPGLTHYDIFMSPLLAATALAFLNQLRPAARSRDRVTGRRAHR